MGMKKCLSLAVMLVLFALLLSVSALADYDMWVESYYEITVVQTDSARRLEDYYLFEGVCTGLDFYISGDGTRLVLYGAPLVPGDYYFDVLLTYDDGGYEYMDFWVIVNPIEVVEPDPTPAPAPTAIPDVYITKHPYGETVSSGESAVFIARADHVYEIIWHVVTPEGETYDVEHAPYDLPGLKVTGQGTETVTLSNIPQSMNGWSLECMFVGLDGVSTVTTSRAKITVNAPPPTPAPTAEPESTAEPASTEEPRATREPKPTEIPSVAIVDDGGEDKGGKDAGAPEDAGSSSGFDFRLVAAIALGVIGIGLVAVLLIMLTKKKPSAGAGEAPAASSPYTFRCDKCGWKPADPGSIPRFCPNCGDAFDEKDVTVASRERN